MLGKQLQTAAAGSAAAGGLGVEDVFSTYLTVGSSGQTITNGIDLSTEGGMVWSKNRPYAASHAVHDTERGTNKFLSTNSTAAQIDVTSNTSQHSITSFNTDGFTTGNDGGYAYTDYNGYGDYVHWTFRKAPGFFDVVTYAGDGTSNRQISHNLGSTPGMIIVKNTSSSTFGWYVWHRSLSSNQEMLLNSTAAASSNSFFTAVTSTYFSPINNAALNGSGSNYVAYFFAHDDAIFGENADQSVIKCGTVNIGGSGTFDVNLGWEPQWILFKYSGGGGGVTPNWYIFDNMRGLNMPSMTYLFANTSGADTTLSGEGRFFPHANGFKSTSSSFQSGDYIYVAIRRGPMKTPTDATEVFTPLARTGTGANQTITGIGFPHDMVFTANRSYIGDWKAIFDRLRGNLNWLLTTSTGAEGGSGSTEGFEFDNTTGTSFLDHANNLNRSGQTYIDYFFRRAPGFFDVVTFTGTGNGLSSQTVSHNLTVAPELIIHKCRSNSFDWWCWHQGLGGADKYLKLHDSNAVASGTLIWGNTLPTATQFTVGSGLATSGRTFVVYLFATVDGVSKVGSYTGTGSDINVDCGFTAGARFVLIKRTDNTGDWYFFDSVRGIVSGNDPQSLINTTYSETTTTDYIDPYSAGFTITSSAPAAMNASGGSYIFLAIA